MTDNNPIIEQKSATITVVSKCILYIVRHGQSTYNRDNIVSGHVDPQLTDLGRKQAEEAKLKLQNVVFDEAYSSDLQRAIDTAEIIFGKPVPHDHRLPGLRERNFGEVDGEPAEKLIALRANNSAAFETLSHAERWAFKHSVEMESDQELAERFISTLEHIALDNAGKTILIAAHGGSLRVTLLQLGYLSPEELPPGSFKNAGYIELAFEDGEFEVLNVNGIQTPEWTQA